MRVGTLEIQIMAGLARLQKDMNDAQRMVGGAMGNVERSVASAKRAMQTLGVGLPLAAITDQVRRMSDQYTKLDAQIRLATKSQAAYAQGMADIRRISTIAQADISATSMLYTRLINTMEGTGVSQQKLATVTETISFGLKAYGATTQEAASAALQLSQAMGANRLGGEEFRAVMEAMPNVMKVLADSMGVPLGSLRQLSIDGKITADEMVKAFGNPAVAAQFKALAMSTQTVTGAWQVARNELMLLVGEFTKSSGITNSTIAAFNAFGAVFRFMADNIGILTNALMAYVSVMAGKFVAGLVQARMAQMAANAAAAEAAVANVAAAESAVFAAKANLAGAAAAARAGGSMAVASAAAKEYAASVAALAAAEKAQAASSVGIMGRIKGLAGRAGWIGMALFGAWTVYDFLNNMQQVADGADKLKNKFEGMSLAEVQMARQRELIRQIGMRGTVGNVINEKEIRASQDMIRAYDQQIAKMVELQNAETRAQQTKIATAALSHDDQVAIARYNELLQQYNDKKLTQAEYEARVLDMYGQGAKAAKAYAKEQRALAAERKRAGAEGVSIVKEQIRDAAAIDSETASLVKQIEAIKLETESIGKTKAEIDLLQAARFDHETQIMRETLATLDAANACTAESGALRDAIKAREQYKKAQTDQSARHKAQEQIAAEKNAQKDLWDSIDRTAHDTFVNMLEGGRNTAARLKDAFKSMFYDWLYQMTVKKWIVNVSGQFSTSGSGSALSAIAGGGGGGGLGDILNVGSSLWSAFSGGMASGIGSIATSAGAMFGSTALTEFGLGASSTLGAGMMGPTMAGAGGMAGLGSAFAAAAPYVAAALAVFSLFGGGKGKPTSSTSDVTQTYDALGKRTGQTVGVFGGTGGAPVLDALAKSIADLRTAFGATGGDLRLFYGSNTGKNGESPNFLLAGGGYSTGPGETPFSQTALDDAMARVMLSALKNSNLPGYLSKVFNTIDISTATKATVENVIAFATTLKQTRDALTETRTPMKVLNDTVTAGMASLNTSSATFKADFVAAIDAGLTAEEFAKWQQLAASIGQVAQAWQGLTDALFNEVARIRGLSVTPSSSSAQFATLTAMARAGDQNAANALVGASQTMLAQAEATATSALELARTRAYVANSLQTTGTILGSQYGTTLPSFAVGTDYVPSDMVARIHKGERITPAAYNRSDSTNADLVAELRALRAEVSSLRASSDVTASATRKTSDLLRNVTQDGNSLLTTPA